MVLAIEDKRMRYPDPRPSPQLTVSEVITKMSLRGIFTALVTMASLVTADNIIASVNLCVYKGQPMRGSSMAYLIPPTRFRETFIVMSVSTTHVPEVHSLKLHQEVGSGGLMNTKGLCRCITNPLLFFAYCDV